MNRSNLLDLRLSETKWYDEVSETYNNGISFAFNLKNSKQLDYIHDYSYEEPTRVVDIGSNMSLLFFLILLYQIWIFNFFFKLDNNLREIKYTIKEYNYSNRDYDGDKRNNALFFALLQLSGQSCIDILPSNMYDYVKPSIRLPDACFYNETNEFNMHKFFSSNIHPLAIPALAHNTSIKNWFALTCSPNIKFSYTLQTHNNRTVHNDYYFAFDFVGHNYQLQTTAPKTINGIMKVFIQSQHLNETFRHRTRRNFLFIVDTVPFINTIKWFNQIHYYAPYMKFEFHDKLKKDRRYQCLHLEDEVEKLKCEFELRQEKQFDSNDNDLLDKNFLDSLVFKVYLYFHLKDEELNDYAHLFFEINEYKTGKKFYNQNFYSHLE
jgi:hypothetical protein